MSPQDKDRESYEAPQAEDLDSEEGTVSATSGAPPGTDADDVPIGAE